MCVDAEFSPFVFALILSLLAGRAQLQRSDQGWQWAAAAAHHGDEGLADIRATGDVLLRIEICRIFEDLRCQDINIPTRIS